MTTTEQLRLDGQVAAPDGPIDLSGMYLMHRAFRRDLALFVAAAGATPEHDRACWTRLSARWDLFTRVLHKHHTGEDAGLWPLLRERVTGPADAAVLDAMAAEHERLDPLLARCADGFAVMAATGDEADRAGLRSLAAETRDALEAHLAHEEGDAMALVQAHLSPADWERVDREHFASAYGLREVPAVLGWVLDGLPDDVARRLPGAGPVLLHAGRVFARRFARAESRTFRHVLGAPPLTAGDRLLVRVSRTVAAAHTALFRATGGRAGNRFRGGDVLLLTVTGRRSGRQFTTPLLYLRDGADLVVAASNGGIDAEPQWWRNLLADPRATVEVGDRSTAVTAEEVQDPERAVLWDRLAERLPAYDGYQAGVGRRIAVVRLRPTG